ncbi:toxin glutamine deamidase domain-containing protein [Dactylosporangium matsuzakiense]|uniref:Papain fold toxin 1 (Glutamine deamidase) of polymorphic toxin system n=1 Tax=Dactylosporangium matsuzakiense TaxID=53360 RepID=A0A9W6KUP0_9ACTN|nr:toxin glutamine deamidase domain-containing protein [Dactylosporangium matsuzakiense]GLL07552.1 hypothetical protein GCM10017581_093060 [Dactylosporangium matsuzakiense]
MAIEKPDLHPVDWLWDAVCIIGGGSAWPEGNEDHLRDLAHAWQDLGTELNGLLNNADTIAMQVAQAWGGDAGEAFNTYWNALAVGPEHGLPQVADIAMNYSAAAENAAMEIEYAKLVLMITLVVTVITIVICQILAAFTFGGSEAAAGAAVATARTIAGRVLQRLIAWVGKGIVRKLFVKFVIHEVQQIAFSVGTDYLAQQIQIAEGTRRELDTHSLLNSLVSGAVTGALTFPLNFVHLPVKNALPRVAANAAVHGASNALIMPASMMLTTGFMTGDWSWENITQGISLETFLAGAAMGGTMGGIGAVRAPGTGAHGVETTHVDGDPAAAAGETGAHGIDTSAPAGLTGDPVVTTGETGPGADGFIATGDHAGADVAGAGFTPGDGQSLAPAADHATGGSITTTLETATGAPVHGAADPVVTQHANGGEPVSTQHGSGEPVVQRAGEDVHSGFEIDAKVHSGFEPVAEHPAAFVGTDRPAAAVDGIRTTESGPRTTETGSRTTESGPRTTETGPRTAETGPRTAETGTRTTDTGTRTAETGARSNATGGRTAETGARTTDGAGRASDGAGRASDGAGRASDGAGRGSENTRSNDGVRTTDGGRTREQNQTNGSFRAPEKSGEPARDGGGQPGRGEAGGRHRAEEPVALFVPLPRLDDMPVRIGGGEQPPGAVPTRPVPVHEAPAGHDGGGHGPEPAGPGRDHGAGGGRGDGPSGGGDDPPPPPGDRPGGGGDEPASKLSGTRTADGTRSYEGPPRHFEGEPASREGKVATDASARDLADAVQRQADGEGIGRKNRVRVAAAMLTPDEPTIRSHTSTRPMKAGDGSVRHLELHPEAARVLDEIKAAAARDPDGRTGINHGRCAEVVLVSDKLYELEAQWRAAGEPGDFPVFAREQLRDGVVGTHWIGEGTYQEHGDYAPPCDTCGPFIEDFGIHSIDPSEIAAAHEPATGPHAPAAGAHDSPAGPHERPPESLGRVDEQTVADTRTADVRAPSDRDVQALNDKFPRDEHGNPLRQPDVRRGDFAHEYNDGGHKVPGRNNNCGEVSMATLANHRGEPTVAGSMRDPLAGGEHGAADRISRWTGGQWEMQGGDVRGFDGVERQLRAAGPGSGSIVVVKWSDSAEGHAFNALNIHGDVVWVDMQRGLISDDGPIYHDNVAGVWSITVDAHGNPLVPLDYATGLHHAAVEEGAPARPDMAGEDTRTHFYDTYDLSDEVTHRGTTVKVDMYTGIADGKYHIHGDPKGTWRIAEGNLVDRAGFATDWHTAERQDLQARAVQLDPAAHPVRPDDALPKDPVEGVHDASQAYYEAHDAADLERVRRRELLGRIEELLGPGSKTEEDLEPGARCKRTIAELSRFPGTEDLIRAVQSSIDTYHRDMNGVRIASGEAAMHAGLGVAHHEIMHPSGEHAGLVVDPEHVTVHGDPAAARPNELDIIALRYDESRNGEPGYNRLDIWEAKGGSSGLGTRYDRELGGRVEQGTGPYLKWMLENDPAMLRLYVRHPSLLEAIHRGHVTIGYHKVTTTVLDRPPPLVPGDAATHPRDPRTGRPAVIDGTSTTHVREFWFVRGPDDGTHNFFEQDGLRPNFKVLDLLAERAAARGELPPSLSGPDDPEAVHGVVSGAGGRVWHAELPLPMTFHGAEPHAVEAHVRGLLRGAADPRNWVDGAPPRIVVHAGPGIDAATARLIEHTRIDFTQPDPAHPVPEPRITVEGPRLHDPAAALGLTPEILAEDRRDRVPYFNAQEQARSTVRCAGGRLYDAEGLPLHGEYIYAVDPSTQEIHAYPFGADETRHSSLFAGGRVDGAGTLNVEHGRVTGVDNASGHYRPVADHVAAARDALLLHGADLSEAEFRAGAGRGPTAHSTARGAAAFDRALAELDRPGAIDGVAGVRLLDLAEGGDRTGAPTIVEVRLTGGAVLHVDAAGVRDFLQAPRADGPDAGLPEFARHPHTTGDADLAYQGADHLRDRITGELDRLGGPNADGAEPGATVRAPRPDHVLIELDRLLAERVGAAPLHDVSGEPLHGPRDHHEATAALRSLSDEHIAALVAAGGLTGEPAARLAAELAGRRDLAIERHGRPPIPPEIERMAGAVRKELGYYREGPDGRELYDILRRRAYEHTGGLAHGMTLHEAARAVDAAVVAAGGAPRYERMLDEYLGSPDGRAHHAAVTDLDLATIRRPRFELEDPRFAEPAPQYAAEQAGGHADLWSGAQRRALTQYTSGIGREAIEHFLRTGEARTADARTGAYRIQGAMRETTGDLRLHGRVDLRDLGIAHAGELPRLVDGHVTLDTFTHLDGDAGARPHEEQVRVVVEAPAGTPIAWVARAGESGPEVHALLGAGARLHVAELRRIEFGRYELHLRYEGYEDPAALVARLHAAGPPSRDVRPPHDGGPRPGDVRPQHDGGLRPGDVRPPYDGGPLPGDVRPPYEGRSPSGGVRPPYGPVRPVGAGTVQAIARAAGIDMAGVEVWVAGDAELGRYLDEQGVVAIRPPEAGGRVLVLGPAALADPRTLAAALREHEGDADDPDHGGEGVRLAGPGADGLGLPARGDHRAGDAAGQRGRGPGDGAGDRGGEPAGPAGGVGHRGAGANDTDPGGRGRDAHGGAEPAGAVHVSRDAGPGGAGAGDDRGGHCGDDASGSYIAADLTAILGGRSAAGLAADHPGAGSADPGVGAHDDPVGPGAAPDPAAATLGAQRLGKERAARRSPELAGVVGRLLDDPHALGGTGVLRDPALRALVLWHIEELAAGDALAPYGGSLELFLADHPGRGPLYAQVPGWVNRVAVDGVERTRVEVHVAGLQAADPALTVGADATPAERARVQDYAERLRTALQPAVDRALCEITAAVRGGAEEPVTYSSRVEDAAGLIDRVGRMSRGRGPAPGRPGYRVGDILDAVSARITVPDTVSLWRALELVRERFGVGDGGRILEVHNMYASPEPEHPQRRAIPLTIGIEADGRRYAFELRLATLRASIAADIEHHSLSNPSVAISAAEAEAVRRASREAAARDQLEGAP